MIPKLLSPRGEAGVRGESVPCDTTLIPSFPQGRFAVSLKGRRGWLTTNSMVSPQFFGIEQRDGTPIRQKQTLQLIY